MKLPFYISALALLLLVTSCENYKAKLEEEQNRQNLLIEQLKGLEEEERLIKGEYADAMETLGQIDATLSEMAGRNKEMDKLVQQKELVQGTPQEQVVLAKLQALKQANIEADQQARRLQSKVKAFKVENEELKKMIAQMETKFVEVEAEVNKLQTTIGSMQQALTKLEGEVTVKDSELASAYGDLKVKISKLEETNKELEVTLADLESKDAFIGDDAKAYIACGVKDVLRRNKIIKALSAKTLMPGYQAQVKTVGSEMDFANNELIDCGDGTIEFVLPNRDPASYKVEGSKVTILNKKIFWATSKTVVLVKK